MCFAQTEDRSYVNVEKIGESGERNRKEIEDSISASNRSCLQYA